MVTRDVLKVLKLHSPTARAILRTFKTSLVPINHEMHSRSYDFLYVLSTVLWKSNVYTLYIFVVLFLDGKIADRQTNNSSSSLIQRRSFSFIDKLSIECPYHLCNVDPWIIISLRKLKIKKVWAKDVTSMTNSPAIQMHITIQNWCKATNANLF